MATTIY